MDGREIRELFLSFFEERGHRRVPSSSLISPDPSLLLTTAGMVQFIPYFLGRAESPYGPRVTTAQKAFRTTDIDLVGHTARHLTFFEMLGNFSFGDYFKKEACAYAYELVTERFGIDADRLWVTVFETDDEAADIWADEVGIPRDRIVRRGWDDNFWWTHAAGPGGPCSEIYVDRGPGYGRDGGPAVDEERFLEVWNLVFMQNELNDAGEILGELPRKNIDTGASLERVAVVLQDVDSVFETDLLRPMLEVAERLSGKRYGEDERTDVSLRILAEHGRATTFLIADGVLPSNEGRGYVLRRMLRRMVSHARRLGVEGPVTADMVGITVEVLGAAYPELVENREFARQVATSEEERFGGTVRAGLTLFEGEVEKASGTLPGDVAFRLHDTHGFPLELTRELAEERGLSVDVERFEELMAEQRERARKAAKKGAVGVGQIAARPTEFVGYETLQAEGTVDALLADTGEVEAAEEGQQIQLVLDRTPFYAEGGGQVGDAGILRTAGGIVRIEDAQWAGEAIVHRGVVESGEIRKGETVHAEVDRERRQATARSHTATHVVHWTLKRILGEHARQAGSLVAPGRLRFDFTHHAAVPPEEIEEVESTANERLSDDDPVRAYETTFDFAKGQGAVALFGEKYGDIVRVVEIGDYSRELCGGTHVPHTGKVAVVRILGEASIGSGLRRIEALTGPDALRHVNLERRLLEDVVEALGGGDPATAPERVRRAFDRIKQLESELGRIQEEARREEAKSLLSFAKDVCGVQLVVEQVIAKDMKDLERLAKEVRARFQGPGAVVLGSIAGGEPHIVAACSNQLVLQRKVTAPALLEDAKIAIKGGGGGKEPLAFAGGREPAGLPTALGGIEARLKSLLGCA